MDQSAPLEDEMLEARIVDIEMTSAVPPHRPIGSAGEGRRGGPGAEEKDADIDAIRKPSMVSSDRHPVKCFVPTYATAEISSIIDKTQWVSSRDFTQCARHFKPALIVTVCPMLHKLGACILPCHGPASPR